MKQFYRNAIGMFISLLVASCSDFIEIDPPRTDLVRTTVFARDETANAAALDMYYQMANQTGFGGGGLYSVSFLPAMSADEGNVRFAFLRDIKSFNTNSIVPANAWNLTVWSDLYKTIYKSNAILEGLTASASVSEALRNHLIGEAFFIRALCHFYLVNLYGDVPLVLTTDYEVNQVIGRTPTAEVYQQIEEDLLQAQQRMNDDFSLSADEKIRPCKSAATAMLARVSLYRTDWAKAEEYSSVVIASGKFSLGALNQTFLKNSNEAIFQVYAVSGNAYDKETAFYFNLHPSLLSAFEVNDQRNVEWVAAGRANKYRSNDLSRSEYSTVLRLAEQYLIRAEARAQQDNIGGAQEDLNVIRARAGLNNTSAANKSDMLTAIEQERRVELFLEWGHRWLDLKRYGLVDEVMAPLKTEWQSTDALYPIPESQIVNDPTMKNAQNPGY